PTLGYVAGSSVPNTASLATLVVIQRSGSHAVNVLTNHVGRLTTLLAAGPVQIAVENAPGMSYGNAAASCWSHNGR
ncbi:MAG: hypothetical protein QOC82_2793, partial [Frankiaceae bacterium]|nr:hypothetical protein [Frankiaceae bacterium]